MEGMDKMIWIYILTAIYGIGLVSALIYSIYMAVWGVYDEY